MTEAGTTRTGSRGSVMRGALILLLLLAAAFAVSTVPGVRSSSGFVVLLDGWLQGAVYALSIVVAVGGVLTGGVVRSVWTLLAGAIALRGLAFVVYLGVLRRQDAVPVPSVSDLLWIASGALLVAVVVLRPRRRWISGGAVRVSWLLTLDVLACALLVCAVAIAVLLGPLTDLSSGVPTAAIVVNLIYPVLDVVALIGVFGLLLATGGRLSRVDALLGLGIVGIAVGDVAYLVLLSQGSFGPGSPLAGLSVVSTCLLVLACCDGAPPSLDRHEDGVRQIGVAVPAVIATLSVGALATAHLFDIDTVAGVVLVACGAMALIVRALLTVSGDRALADSALREKNAALLRFQALVETSTDFIAIAGMDGKVIYVNPAGRELVGIEPDRDVRTTEIMDYLTEEGQRASVEIEQPAVVAHGRWEGESTLRDRRGGPPIPVAISSFLMRHPESGEPFALATVQRDITERLAAQRALEELAHQRQMLLARLVQAQEDERAAIAADVHDDSVQALAAVDLRLGLLRRQLEDASPALVENVDKALDSVQDATGRLRHLLFDLESPAQHDGLAAALGVAAEYVFEDTGITWQITGDLDADLPTPSRVTAYRIAKEAMSNVRRHARATRVQVGLARGDDGVLVTIADDGVGMAPGLDRHRAGHRGLASSRDRATVAGGWLRVEGAPGEGTRIILWLPVVTPERPDEEGQDEPDEY